MNEIENTFHALKNFTNFPIELTVIHDYLIFFLTIYVFKITSENNK